MPTHAEFVLDSSDTLSWCFPDEQDSYALIVLESLAGRAATVPSLWAIEVANIPVVGERRGRISHADTATFLDLLERLPIDLDDETSQHAMTASLSLARTYGISAYDATYLELAIRQGLPLSTLDAKLRATATAAGVALYAET